MQKQKSQKDLLFIAIGIFILLVVGAIAIIQIRGNGEFVSVGNTEKDIVKVESELLQVKQIVDDKNKSGTDVSGLQEDIKQIEILIETAREKINEGNETGARAIIERIRIFNLEIINNSDNITNVFKTDVKTISGISLPVSTQDSIRVLGDSFSGMNKFVDLRIKIKKDSNGLKIDEKTLGEINLNQEQKDRWNSIKESVKETARDSNEQKFEIEVRLKRELEFENQLKFEREFESELRGNLTANLSADAKLSREQAIEIAKTRVNGTLGRVELEIEDGRLQWNVRIVSNGTRNDIRVDDATGTITRFRTREDSGNSAGQLGTAEDNRNGADKPEDNGVSGGDSGSGRNGGESSGGSTDD